MELIRFKKDELPTKSHSYISYDPKSDEYLRMYWDEWSDYWRVENYFNCLESRMFVEHTEAYEEVLKDRAWILDNGELDTIFQVANKNALKKIFRGKK